MRILSDRLNNLPINLKHLEMNLSLNRLGLNTESM